LIFAREPYSVIDFGNMKLEKKKNLEEYVQIIKDDLEKAWKISKELISKTNKKLRIKLKNKNKKFVEFERNQLVLLKGRGDKLMKTKDKSINPKLSNRNIGPFEIVEINEDKNAIIQITPSKTQAFHFNDLILYEGKLRPFPEGYFTPSINEIIKIVIPEERGPFKGEKILPCRKKKK